MGDSPKGRNSKKFRAATVLTSILLGIAVVTVGMRPEIRWRAEVIRLKAVGDLPDLEWFWLIRNLRPGSPFYLEGLATLRNPYSVIINPYVSKTDIDTGGEIFRSNCGSCHEGAAHGSAQSVFNGEFSHGDSDWAIFRSIRDGFPSTGMLPQRLNDEQIWRVIAFLRHQDESLPNIEPSEDPAFQDLRPVSFESMVDGSIEPGNWPAYSGAVAGARFSRLDALTKENVDDLKLAWVYQGSAHDYHVEATPIVVDGILVTTEPPGSVVAMNAETGRVLWRHSIAVPGDIRICCGTVNRGVAVRNSSIFVGTLDAHLIALDIRSGNVLWDAKTAEYSEGYSNTAAPLVVGDKVLVGVAGGEFGIRGFVAAYEIDTGARLWQFETIPAPGVAGNETWQDESWRTGGGPTWMTGSYDVETNLVYWGIGNPGPDFSNQARQGDNLYTNSIVALDADSGHLRWSFQFTPGDLHDYDANHVPVIAELLIEGRKRKVVMSATKNGFFYVLDAESGEFISALEITRQTWALKLDTDGRPIRNEAATPTLRGTRAYPSAAGGANWWPPTFNPNLRIYTVPVLEGGAIFYSTEDDFRQGELFVGGSAEPIPGESRYVSLKAIRPEQNEIVWELRGSDDRDYALTGGTLSTATELLFWGDSKDFYALDALTGKILWQTNVGGNIVAAPMTYSVNGKQYVAVSAGRGLFVFAL